MKHENPRIIPVDEARLAELVGENEKLRELVETLYQCSRDVGCDHCGDGYRRRCSVLARLRELGVE